MKKTALLFPAMMCLGLAVRAQVGIGTTTPTYPLTVISDANNKGIAQKAGTTELGFYVSTGSAAYVQTWSPHDLYFTTNNGSAKIAISNATGNVGILTTSPTAAFDINGTFRRRGNGAAAGAVLTSDASGNATWQAPSGGATVGFRGVLSNNTIVTQANGQLQLTGFSEAFDDGGGFDGVAGTFTAPSDGVYQFVVNLNWNQSTNTTGTSVIIARLYRNSSILEQTENIFTNNTSYGQNQNITSICKLTAGDVVTVEVDPQVNFDYTVWGNGSAAGRFAGTKLY